LTHRDDGHGTVLLFLRLGARDLASQSDDRRMRTMHGEGASCYLREAR
jgi:hypothetical protein